MNQDQVKLLLLSIESKVDDFSVILSGKQSKKVNGLYRPETREIILHNRNFADDNALVYTAIHEFAHHIQYTQAPRPIGVRAHTIEFRAIFHRLLLKAEQLNLYQAVQDQHPELAALAKDLRTRFVSGHGNLMLEFGRELIKAEALCRQHNARFDDFLERVLGLSKNEADRLMRMSGLELSANLGLPAMKTLSQVRDQQLRASLAREVESGASVDMIKHAIAQKNPPLRAIDNDTSTTAAEDPGRAALAKIKLEKERIRLIQEMQRIKTRIEYLDAELSRLDE